MYSDMCALYAYMRITDDLGDDESLSLIERQKQLQLWRDQLRQAFEETTPDQPVLTAIADVARRREISLSLLEEVINGVESDLSPVLFQTFQELEHYCYQVAGVVGICCLKIWGCRPDISWTKIESLAIDCGTALQLTNILRDLKEDADRGRLYLPCEDLEQFQLTRDALTSLPISEPFRLMMNFQVNRTWDYYRRALPLVDLVSDAGRPILCGFLNAYSRLLKQIENHQYDVISQRIRLSRLSKLMIAGRSVFRCPARLNIPE